jgi:hypothetical protein
MKEATLADKIKIVDILTNAFDDNSSVNYIVKQGEQRVNRIKFLMNYSFEMCAKYGKVYLSDDEKACALVLFPEFKKDNFWTIRKAHENSNKFALLLLALEHKKSSNRV